MDFRKNIAMQNKDRFPLIACPNCHTRMRHVSGSPTRQRICPGCGNKFDPTLCAAQQEVAPSHPAPLSREKTRP